MTKFAPEGDYDRDFYAWANEQTSLLRAGKVGLADLEHIAEEIECLGKTEKRELVSRLTVLMLHLLKWRFQPEFRSTSWRLTIEEQRLQVASHLSDNSSLKTQLAASIADGYRLAVISARRETGLDKDNFPTLCPWLIDQMMNDVFWPQ
jgi:hypothetical protein